MRWVAGAALLIALCGCNVSHRKQAATKSAGLELVLLIDVAFARPDGLYAGELRDGKPNGVAHCWPGAVQLSALAAAARVDDRWKLPLSDYAAALDAHWSVVNKVAGYDASPRPQKPDRYYDDNAWMALALLDTYAVTRNAEHLHRAKDALDFALGGEDSTLGGGIYWHEQTRQSKNTCANAPTIVACLRMTRVTGNAKYAAAAQRLYDWTRSRLRDRDGLYLDRIDVTGQIEPTKFSYNSAMMILANCEFFDATQEVKYLDDARATASAALKFWVMPASGAVEDDVPFAALLVESFLELYRRDGDRKWRTVAASAVEFARTRNVDRAGWHPPKWDTEPRQRLSEVRLIDQSAAARAMLMAEIIR